MSQIAKDVGISESCLRNWLAQADVDAGGRPGVSTDERRELVELRRRNRVLEMEVEILKRASAYFARGERAPKMTFAFISQACPDLPVAVCCRVMKVSTSGGTTRC